MVVLGKEINCRRVTLHTTRDRVSSSGTQLIKYAVHVYIPYSGVIPVGCVTCTRYLAVRNHSHNFTLFDKSEANLMAEPM
jgi:hypothetical protein